ncbi:hypothetical protein MTO96_010213 [Rhipicephalus appendiculatus]
MIRRWYRDPQSSTTQLLRKCAIRPRLQRKLLKPAGAGTLTLTLYRRDDAAETFWFADEDFWKMLADYGCLVADFSRLHEILRETTVLFNMAAAPLSGRQQQTTPQRR